MCHFKSFKKRSFRSCLTYCFAKDLQHSPVMSDVTFDSLQRWNHKLVINPEVTNYCVSLHHCRSQEIK